MDTDNNALLKALPPETDYLSYLTILEYNLTKEQLPTLRGILQDPTLTTNIGWDLVHLLLPLLPESQQCLQDVARLGNPREVVLKVGELLEGIANESDEQDEELQDEGELEKDGDDGAVEGQSTKSRSPLSDTQRSDAPSRVSRFTAMLDMLSVLHPRIKTKYPSRFLSTSLQAVLSAYTSLSGSILAIESVLGLVKQLSGTGRPALPPRKSSSAVLTQTNGHSHRSAPDPEANEDGLASGEVELQKRLLQSFLTYVTEVYLSSLMNQVEDPPGMAWASRFQEVTYPDKCVPGRHKHCELYGEIEELRERDVVMGQVLALTRDLGTKPEQLSDMLATSPSDGAEGDDDDLPSSPADVPLSRLGALYILCAMAASPILFQGAGTTPSLAPTLPDYTLLINGFVSDPSMGGIGTENESLLDALFFLGFYTFHARPQITPINDEEFNHALQRLSLLSANLPSPTLRYQAHQLASRLLHLHPSENIRLAYIKDTLENCPYESLKGSAVEWLKDEILAANTNNGPAEEAGSTASLFASPHVIEAQAGYLWPEIQGSSHTEADYKEFRSLQVFYLALLNLLYLLLSNPVTERNLGISRVAPVIATSFLRPLIDEAKHFEMALHSGDLDYADRGELDARVAEMTLLMMNAEQVMAKIKQA
ncbi:MAG: hypothetical protein Q9163_005867 [Psora crenata]